MDNDKVWSSDTVKTLKVQEIKNLYMEEIDANVLTDADIQNIINFFSENDLYSNNINELILELIRLFNG